MKRVIALAILMLVPAAFAANEPAMVRLGKVIAVTGKATASKSGAPETDLKVGDELPQGALIKTASGAKVNIYFRRIGTIFQLQENGELKIDRLEMRRHEGKLIKETELSLNKGRLLSCIRVLIPDSNVLVRTPGATFDVPGSGMGRFDFRADGSALVGRRSKLTLVAEAGGQKHPIQPGQWFDGKMKRVVQAEDTLFATFTPEMDRLQKTASELTPPPQPDELP